MLNFTILSIPLGPRLVRTTSATALAAVMLLLRTSIGLSLLLNDFVGAEVAFAEADITKFNLIHRIRKRNRGLTF